MTANPSLPAATAPGTTQPGPVASAGVTPAASAAAMPTAPGAPTPAAPQTPLPATDPNLKPDAILQGQKPLGM